MAYPRCLVIMPVLLMMAACSTDGKPGNADSPPAGKGAHQLVGSPVAPRGTRIDDTSRATAVKANNPPEIRRVWFVGGDGRADNVLGVEAEAYDADGDDVAVGVVWSKNGRAAGSGMHLPGQVRRGDTVVATITPSDGKAVGKPVSLTRVIRNTPPVIAGHDRFRFEENIATFHVRASDPDGDVLSYSLKDAPAGMSIDNGTGIVRWAASPGTTGRILFTVVVSDGSGGQAMARFTVTIAEQPRSEIR